MACRSPGQRGRPRRHEPPKPVGNTITGLGFSAGFLVVRPIWRDPAIIAAIIGAVAAIIAALIAILPHILHRAKKVSQDNSKANGPRPNPADAPPVSGANLWAERHTVDYGIFYKARKTISREADTKLSPDASDAAILVVFVHGILGSPADSWGSLGQLLREGSSADFDLLAYGYAAGLLYRASIESGASELSTALKHGRFRKYQHLIFVTHSTGGLLLKHILKEDYDSTLREIANPEKRIEDIPSIAFRARQVINIAVPHSGGSFASSVFLISLYHLLFLPILVPAMVIDKLLRGLKCRQALPKGYDNGYNKIVWQLRWRNHGLKELEKDYRQAVRSFDRRRLPRPVSIEVNGTADTTIDKGPDDVRNFSLQKLRATEDRTSLFFRGKHPTVKTASNVNDTIVVFLAGFLERYQRQLDVLLAKDTVKRTIILDRDATLVGARTIEAPDMAEWTDTAEAPGP